MNGVLGHDSALLGCSAPGTTWDNEMNSVMNHAPGVESIARPVVQLSNAPPLCYRHPQHDCSRFITIDAIGN